MDLYINSSNSLKHFKNIIGQANHFIITALLGLDLLQKAENYTVPKDFHTSWNPKNKNNTINRTRIFILKTALSRAVDAIEIYIDTAKRKPFLFQNDELLNQLNNIENSQSVTKKINIICDYYKINKNFKALVNFLIVWRNKITHTESNNLLNDEYREIIKNSKTWLTDTFCGLDADKLIEDFDKNTLTFKEVTSLLHATHIIIKEIELSAFNQLNITKYTEDLLYKNLYEESGKDNNRLQQLSKIWGKKGDNKIKSITKKLQTYGISNEKTSEYSLKIDEATTSKIYKMTPNELIKYIEDIKNNSVSI